MATSAQIKAYANENNCSNAEARFHFIESAKENMSQVIDNGFKHNDMFDSKGNPQLVEILEAIYDDNQQMAHDLIGGFAMDCVKQIDFLEDNASRNINTKMSDNVAHDDEGVVQFELDPYFVDIRGAGRRLALKVFNSYINDWKKGKRCLMPGLMFIENTISTSFTHMFKPVIGDAMEMSIHKLKMPNGKYTTNISINPVPSHVYKGYMETIKTGKDVFLSPETA
tara:strand:- start:218 stop:892 length:675 start_codon:yes stop_codon:yes gene_type:complete